MSRDMSNYLHIMLIVQCVATLVLPPFIFAAVLILFMGFRKLRSAVWG
jgi:hypothetical protein